MDVDAWLDDRLIDVLTMSCLMNDYNQRLEPWLTRCRESKVAFYPSIEANPAHNSIHNHVTPESLDETIKRQRGAAQNFLGQGADGVYMFNYPCHLFQLRRTPGEFKRLTAVLSEIGRQETLAAGEMQFAYWKNLPLQVESRRPADCHQTIHFSLFHPHLTDNQAMVQLSFRQATEANPHVDKRVESPTPSILLPGWVTYWLNGKQVPESWINRESQEAGRIVSGFDLGVHEKVTLNIPASALQAGDNTIGFYVPRFPEINDPYIMIYELLLDISASGKQLHD